MARYLWNLALISAFSPILHTLEVAFRNALFEVGNEVSAGRVFQTRNVPTWLDANPSMLQPQEEKDVQEAIQRLGRNARRHTPGHLVSQLGFGFWIRLCNRPYEQGNVAGPGLWPTAVKRFQGCPRKDRTREKLRTAFDAIRDFRNEIAHHQPIWDRKVLEVHGRIVELLGWMNPRLAAVAAHHSQVSAVYLAGLTAWRPIAGDSFVVY